MAHRPECPCPACRYRRRGYQGQSPRLTVRLDPEVRVLITAHPEGARAYLERLVREDDRRKGLTRVKTRPG